MLQYKGMKIFTSVLLSLVLLCAGLLAMPKISKAAPSVQVTSPNGGTALKLGQTITITWTQSDLDSVTVGFSRGENFTVLRARDVNRNETGGSYQWTLPSNISAVGTDYRIKVMGWQDGNSIPFEDESDIPFGIIEPDYTLNVGSSGPGGKTIDRQAANTTIASFNISNPSSNPKAFFTYGCNIVTTPAVSSRSFSTRIRIGNTVVADHLQSSDCGANNTTLYVNSGSSVTVSVDVSILDSAPVGQFELYANLSFVNAQSAGNANIRAQGVPVKGATFTVPSLASTATQLSLSSPGNKETWKPGEKRTIRWTTKNLPTQAGKQVAIQFVRLDGTAIGQTYKFSSNNSSGEITVPTLAVASDNYRLRLFLECNTYVAACSTQAISANTVYVVGSNPSITPPQSNSNASSSAAADQANRIVQSGTDLNNFLSYRKIKRNSKDQTYAINTFTFPLIGREEATLQQAYAVNNFIVYGVPLTQRLNAKQRFELVAKFKRAYGKIPKTASDWQKVLPQ